MTFLLANVSSTPFHPVKTPYALVMLLLPGFVSIVLGDESWPSQGAYLRPRSRKVVHVIFRVSGSVARNVPSFLSTFCEWKTWNDFTFFGWMFRAARLTKYRFLIKLSLCFLMPLSCPFGNLNLQPSTLFLCPKHGQLIEHIPGRILYLCDIKAIGVRSKWSLDVLRFT